MVQRPAGGERVRPVIVLNLALKFLLELGALVGLGCWGATVRPPAARPVLAMALPLTAATVWSVWAAPRSLKRLSRGPRTAVELSVFAAATAALLATGAHFVAAAFAVLVLINAAVANLGEYPASTPSSGTSRAEAPPERWLREREAQAPEAEPGTALARQPRASSCCTAHPLPSGSEKKANPV